MLIREATPDDVTAIHQMIIELAVYEKEPDAVLASEADLQKALFSDEKSRNGAPAAFEYPTCLRSPQSSVWFYLDLVQGMNPRVQSDVIASMLL